MRNSHYVSARRSGRGLIALGLGLIAGVATPAWAGAPSTGCNAADIAPPFGVLDLQDVGAFVNGFVTNDPIADMNNDGILDLQDVSQFISNFLDGCPQVNCFPDVRTTIDGADLDPPNIQQNYDAINLTIHLVGQIPLGELFAQTPAELAPLLLERLETLDQCVPGSTVDPLPIEIEIVQMSLAGPQIPLGEILAFGPGSLPFEPMLNNLRDLGVGIPEPSAGPDEVAARMEAYLAHVEPGAAVTAPFAALFFQNINEVTPETLEVLDLGKESGLLAAAICDNDKCCDLDGGDIPGTASCET
ncbi:MAG: hypothetical protein K8E66_12125, partial [Phycisphaerales bacterium]|nr:hypothetical protein [Phycisphaerales bacterium]